jgi:hypothetical protein
MKKLIPEARMRARYGGVTAMTIHRWDNDPDLRFPPPIYIRGRKYRDEEQLDAFDADPARRQARVPNFWKKEAADASAA